MAASFSLRPFRPWGVRVPYADAHKLVFTPSPSLYAPRFIQILRKYRREPPRSKYGKICTRPQRLPKVYSRKQFAERHPPHLPQLTFNHVD